MPRPEQHATGDLAVLAVREVFTSIGFAVDEIKNDYGEDLIVQPCLDGVMDACRIWVQVKGTRSLRRYWRHGRYELPVSLAHAHKWTSITDLMVIVLWDVSAKTGLWTRPREDVHWLEELSRPAALSVPFTVARRFDADAATALAWQARIDQYATRLAQLTIAELFDPRVIGPAATGDGLVVEPEMARILVAWELLRTLQVVVGDKLNPVDADVWLAAWEALAGSPPFERHVRASMRMLDAAVFRRSVRLQYPTHLLIACVLFLLRQIRPGGGLDIVGSDWGDVTAESFDGDNGPVTLFEAVERQEVTRSVGDQRPTSA